MGLLDVGKDEHGAYLAIGRALRTVVRAWEKDGSFVDEAAVDREYLEAWCLDVAQRFIDYNYRAGVTGGRQLSLRSTAAAFERLTDAMVSGEPGVIPFGGDDAPSAA